MNITLTGINGVKAQFASAISDMKSIVDQELESMAKEWVNNAKKDAPVDQSTLKGAISYSKDGSRVEIVSGAFYSPFMEFGTKGKYLPIPGTEAIAEQFKGFKNGDFMQMLRMIVQWIHRKGIAGIFSVATRKRLGSKATQQDQDLKAAWPILMSILKNGVNPHPFFFKQQDVVWPEMVRKIKQRIENRSKVSVIAPGEIYRPKIVTI